MVARSGGIVAGALAEGQQAGARPSGVDVPASSAARGDRVFAPIDAGRGSAAVGKFFEQRGLSATIAPLRQVARMQTADREGPRARRGTALALCFSAAIAGMTGCRVSDDDVHRWESTARGPEKLTAVLLHDKYAIDLRVEAALSLIRMKPRQGRRVGIGMMVDTLAEVPDEMRGAIVASLVPAIIEHLKVPPPPVAQAGQPSPPDGSFPFKDAAYAMLSLDRTQIIADDKLKQDLKTALVDWAMADFERRLDNRSQAYGMEQLLKFIGPPAVVGLPKLMTRDAKRLDQMATLVADIGDPATKEAASEALVKIATHVSSSEWLTIKKPEVMAANAASKLEPNEKQLEAQLQQYQEEELFRVFGAMKKVGGRPAVEWLLAFAADKNQSDKKRQGSLAALEGKLDKTKPDDATKILAIATADAPDVVLDQAFRRAGELPRELVADKLYDIFKTDKWKIRRAAGATVLRMSKAKHISEFLGKLPKGAAKGFAMPEALSYGALLGELKEGDVRAEVGKFLETGSPAARTSALSYYFSYGTAADLPVVQPLEDDRTNVPVCETDPDCKWSCEVAKEGAADPKEREVKDIKSIGEFVRYCVEPAMRERQLESKKEEKK